MAILMTVLKTFWKNWRKEEEESYMWPAIEMKFSAFMEAIQFHIE